MKKLDRKLDERRTKRWEDEAGSLSFFATLSPSKQKKKKDQGSSKAQIDLGRDSMPSGHGSVGPGPTAQTKDKSSTLASVCVCVCVCVYSTDVAQRHVVCKRRIVEPNSRGGEACG